MIDIATAVRAIAVAVALAAGQGNASPSGLYTVRIHGLAADGVIVPDPPVLAEELPPAPDPRIAAIDRFLAGSPLEGLGAVFVTEADRYGLDARLMPAVGLHESGLCRHPYGSFNCWGYGPGISFGSYEEAIARVTRTFAGYGVGTHAGLCRWLTGRDSCGDDYPWKVIATMEAIR